jgi:hypothetical protein
VVHVSQRNSVYQTASRRATRLEERLLALDEEIA